MWFLQFPNMAGRPLLRYLYACGTILAVLMVVVGWTVFIVAQTTQPTSTTSAMSEEVKEFLAEEMEAICRRLQNERCLKPHWTGKTRWIVSSKFDSSSTGLPTTKELDSVLQSRGWKYVRVNRYGQASYCKGQYVASYKQDDSVVTLLVLTTAEDEDRCEGRVGSG